MKFSVITCTLNSEPFLAKSIESVLLQDYENIEYIFVDGGSTDGSLERILSIDKEVKLLRGIRGGISNAMNEGIRAATGDVIAHLHSDDFYIRHDALSLAARVMGDDHVGWCYGRIMRLINNQLIPESYVAPAFSPHALIRGNFIPHPATFVRRDWINRVGGFDVGLKYAMDYDLWLKLAKIGKPTEIGIPMTAFRVHAGSLSSSNQVAAMEEDYKVRRSHLRNNPLQLLAHHLRYVIRRKKIIKKMEAVQ